MLTKRFEKRLRELTDAKTPPDKFEQAVWRANADGDCTAQEALRAIDEYNREWDERRSREAAEQREKEKAQKEEAK